MPRRLSEGSAPIPLARPEIGEAEAAAARRALLSGWVSQGPETRAFESEFAARVGSPHAVAVSSCTMGLELLLRALDVAGREVVTVSASFIAGANAIRRAGGRPVFVDIEPLGFNVDPERAREAIGPDTAAILVVHQLGMPCDLEALTGLAAEAGIPLVEDAACAAGSEILWGGAWEPVGRPRGLAACFSFHPRKVITTGEGGLITTGDGELAERLRRLRNHGVDVDADRRRLSQAERYLEPGSNARLSDIQGAVGRVQLGRLDQLVARRRNLAEGYRQRLKSIDGLALPQEPAWARSNWQSYCVMLPDHAAQSRVMADLARQGVASRQGVMCAHREPAFPAGTWACRSGAERCDCGDRCSHLRNGERAQDHGLLLPLFAQMTDDEQDRVADALAIACAAGA